jgi:hypothetical protein
LLNRGFLGPIGDDLPSLVPLLLALVIFFSTFTFAWTVYSDRNKNFENDLEVLNISRILKSGGYVTSYEDFEQKCDSISLVGLKFRAGITNALTARRHFMQNNLSLNPDDSDNLLQYKGIDIFEQNLFYENSAGDLFQCSNVSSSQFLSSPSDNFGNPIIVKIYPLVLEDNSTVKPMHLVVIAWE